MAIQIGGKDIKGLVVGTSSGNKDVVEVWQGSTTGNKLVWQSMFIPEGYVLATDDDFSGSFNGNFKYIGTDEYVIIPDIIKGVAITSYYGMFDGYDGLQLKGVMSHNKNVADMGYMFRNSSATKLNLSSFDTSNVDDMGYMFENSAATELNLSSFDTSNVANMSAMFENSAATKLNLSSFDTSNVADMRYMFHNSAATELNLSSFDTSNVTRIFWIFRNSAATTGYARTQAEADKFNASSGKPAGLTFVVK